MSLNTHQTDVHTKHPQHPKKGIERFQDFSKPITIGLIVLAIGWMAYVFYQDRVTKKEVKARDALFEAQKILDEELTAIAKNYPAPEVEKPPAAKDKKDAKKPEPKSEPKTATIDDIQFKKFDVDQKLAKSIEALKAVKRDHSGSRAAHESLMKVGQLYFNHGQPDKALPIYDEAAKAGQSLFEKGLALNAQALVLEDMGKCEDVFPVVDRAIQAGDPVSKGEGLLIRARCLITLKRNEEAKVVLKHIMTEFPETPVSKQAELYRAGVFDVND